MDVCPACLGECQGAQSLHHTVRTYPATQETAGWSLKAHVTPYVSTSNEHRAPVASGLPQRLVLSVDPVLVPRARMQSAFHSSPALYTFALVRRPLGSFILF